MKKKTIALIVCLTLIIGCAIGGTIAWLTAQTDPVVNTFTVGNVDITLAESPNLDLKMVPGKTITKDPTVTVVKDSEACWLFVKVEKSANFDTFMTYTMADGWTALTGVDGVYYREVNAETATAGAEYPVLAQNRVVVLDTVTKDLLNADDFVAPTLEFTAYACQKDNVSTATDAWAKLNPVTP